MINFNELFTRYGKLISNDYLNIMHKKKFILLILPLLFLSSKISALPACDGNFVRHCYGTIFHQNGEKYVGEIKDNKYNGKGSYLFINGNVYIGEFKDGLQNGQGTSHLQMEINTKEDLKMVITMEKVLQLFQTERIIREIS